MPNYLTLLDVIAIHDRVMRAGGHSPRPLLRSEVLEGALHRPQHVAYYEEADITRQAALLAVAISEAQAFEDGNKTTAFACLDLFLRDNGLLLHGGQRTVADALIRISVDQTTREAAIVELEGLLRQNTKSST